MKQLSKTGMFVCGLMIGVLIMFNMVIYLTKNFTQDYVLLSFLGIITLIVIASFFQEEVNPPKSFEKIEHHPACNCGMTEDCNK